MERYRLGLSLASVLPWSAVPVVGLRLAAWMTRKAGYAFWQVLPLRSVTAEGLRRTGIPVRFAEPAWNATTFRAHFRHELGAEGMPTKLQDPLFFWDPYKCGVVFRQLVGELGVIPVYHDLQSMGIGKVIEVHPELGKTVDQLVEAADVEKEYWPGEEWQPYCVDLHHLRRPQRSGEPNPLGLWQEGLEALLPFTALVHVQALDAEEWQGFNNGKPTELAEMLRVVHNWGYTGPFIVEFDPRAMGLSGLLPWRLTTNLRRVREQVGGLI